MQYARAWAAERGLQLDESLSLRDEGLSAFHQRHVTQGALGVFLKAVDDGRIAPGSVLVVEGLDRLSRAEPIQAQAQLAQIINAGITVVTASDGREYNRERLKAQPMDLVYSLLVMIRAHEESDTKSKRVKAAIRRQCEGWQAGTFRGVIRNGADPFWVRWDGNAWELIPERVEAVLFALARYREGMGAKRLHELMVHRGFDLEGWGFRAAQLYRVVRLVGLKGAKRISVDGVEYLLEGYYPALMSADEFDELQDLSGQRHRRRGKGSIPGIITGIGLAWCGYCGLSVCAMNQKGKVDEAGRLRDTYRRMLCSSAQVGNPCAANSTSVAPLERAVMAYCSDQMNLQRLHEPAVQGQDLRQRVIGIRRRVEDLERQLARVTDALLAGESEGAAPLAFVRKARELEAQIQEGQVELQQAERELAGAATRQTPADAQRWAALASAVEAQDVDARDRVRQLMMDTFERIVIYMKGLIPAEGRAKHLDVLLISKAGQRRWMRIDRKTGVWTAGTDRLQN
ncbi:Resolvase, N terminal domain [Pseudomonas indica]|uniref:Resolvase, N terminal domain n=2 Tax=Pseudomonas indica TaxID=137658 RepID=A0A1G8V3E3_9PSED|nr:Resolvase, N terminal domain [Pseudomonas indica]